MSAPQTAWARPLGNQLVTLFRETAVWFIQGGTTGYDPLTGTVTTIIGRTWHCGAAVTRKGIGRHTEWGQGTTSFLFVNTTDVELWFDSTTLPVEPQASDFVWYQGQRWSVSKVEPALESGMAFYAYKVLISALSAGSAQTDTPPPAGMFPGPVVESHLWLDNGTAPGQPLPGGGPRVANLRWLVAPVGPFAMTPGVAATAKQGTAAGGTAPYTYAEQWFVSADGKTGWAAVPGAKGLSYTPTAADVGQFFQLHVTVTDSATPAAATALVVTSPVVVTPPALAADVLPAVDPASTVFRVGVALLGVPGTATGGTPAITYASKWQASADGKTGWVDLPADPGVPLQVTPLAAQQGWVLRFVTTATDSAKPTAQTLEMHSPNTASLAVLGATGLTRVTLPTVTGNPRVGAVLTAAGAAATGGTAPISYGYRWQFALLRRGPWADIVGAVGTTYTPTAADVGHHLRAVALATDSAAPAAHTLDLPSLLTAAVTGALLNTAVPTLPAAAPSAGTAFGPFTAGTWTGGARGVTYTQHWQSSSDGGKTWADIVGAVGTTYTPVAGDAGNLLRVVETATDGDTPPATGDANSAASLAVVSATTECAGGPVVVRTAAGTTGIGSLYCMPGVWTQKLGGYNPLTGVTSATHWEDAPGGSTLQVGQATDPSTKLTYGRPVGVAADWREVQPGEWHNLRTGEVWHLNAYKHDGTTGQIGGTGGGGTADLGVSLQPWVVGPIVAPSPLVTITVVDKPTPATGTWTQLAPLVTGGMPRWEQTVPATGLTVTQWGDPSKIGTPGAVSTTWLGTGPDPWLRAPQPPAVGGVFPPRPNTWANAATGQKWPADGSNGPLNARPQPPDTATTPRPPASIPNTTAGKANPTYNPWVQLPRVAPVSWWNYVTKTEVHSATQPPIEQWVSPGPGRGTNASTPSGTGTWEAISAGTAGNRWRHINTGAVVEQANDPGLVGVSPAARIVAVGNGWAGCAVPGVDICPAGPWILGTLQVSTTWTRQTDGLQLVQGRRPNIPIDTPADWWESPAGTWHSTLRSEIYVQAGNPGTVGNVVAMVAAVPAGRPGDWVRSGAGTAGDPYKWARASTHQTVTQPGNPGIAGIVGPVVVAMVQLVAPSVGGSLQVGQTLRLTGGTVTGGTGAVTAVGQWQRQVGGAGAWVDIAGAIGTSYALVAGDLAAMVRVQVTHTDSAVPTANTFAHTSAAVGPVVAAAAPLAKATDPTLTGSGAVGSVLRATAGTSTGGTGTVTHTVTVEQADGPGGPWVAVANPYTVVAGDLGGLNPFTGIATPSHIYRATEVVTDSSTPAAASYTAHSGTVAAFAAFAAGTATVGGGPPLNLPVVAAVGTKAVASATAATGGTAPINVTYRWETGPAGGAGPWVVVGATDSYTPVVADGGKALHVVVTWTDSSVPVNTSSQTVAVGVVPAPVPVLGTGTGTIPPAAPGAPYQVDGFVWRAPGGVGAWHWDATGKAWTNGVTRYPQLGNAGVNPGTVPTPADTGEFDMAGVHYGAADVPASNIRWVQVRPGVWQKMLRGTTKLSAEYTQAIDPRTMPA